MKFTKMIMMLVLVGMFLFGSMQIASAQPEGIEVEVIDSTVHLGEGNLTTVSGDLVRGEGTLIKGYGTLVEGDQYTGDTIEGIALSGGKGGTAASNSNSGATSSAITNIGISTVEIVPAPVMSIPNFLSPVGKTGFDTSWTSSPFGLGRNAPSIFHTSELTRVANPSKALGFLWPEWSKSFKVEIACWTKLKPQTTIRVIQYKDFPYEYIQSNIVGDLTKMGEAHAKAVKLHKSEKQVAAALCVFAAKQGAKVVVLHTFSNPVTKADSAVLGGSGAGITGNGNMVTSAGGFGWTTAEKVYRSYVVAELYR